MILLLRLGVLSASLSRGQKLKPYLSAFYETPGRNLRRIVRPGTRTGSC